MRMAQQIQTWTCILSARPAVPEAHASPEATTANFWRSSADPVILCEVVWTEVTEQCSSA